MVGARDGVERQARHRQDIAEGRTAPIALSRETSKGTDMDYVTLGRTGLQVSRICLGCMSYGQAKTPGILNWAWTLSEEDSRPFLKRAFDAGINFYDTANVY